MGFGAFALISLIYCVIGARIAWQVFQQRKALFDDRFTMQDRVLIDQAAFFLLVPVSVALHELGHAMAIWMFGGEVIDFGFYVYAGYVAYAEPFTATQHTIVSAAGAFVNLVLCLVALAAVFLKRPPFRAPVNELLYQFALISGLNAFIFYPLLDFASGLNGDFRQMYSFEAPVASTIILAVHLSILGLTFWALRNPRFQALVAERTGLPRHVSRGVFGGLRPTGRPLNGARSFGAGSGSPFPPGSPLGAAAERLQEAGKRVAFGWNGPVQVGLVPVMASPADGGAATGIALVLAWKGATDGRSRRVIARYQPQSGLQIVGQSGGQNSTEGPARSGSLGFFPQMPTTDELVIQLRIAMETVERWMVITVPQAE